MWKVWSMCCTKVLCCLLCWNSCHLYCSLYFQLSPTAMKDYNRARSYLADLANRDGVPIFENIEEAICCCISKLRGDVWRRTLKDIWIIPRTYYFCSRLMMWQHWKRLVVVSSILAASYLCAISRSCLKQIKAFFVFKLAVLCSIFFYFRDVQNYISINLDRGNKICSNNSCTLIYIKLANRLTFKRNNKIILKF